MPKVTHHKQKVIEQPKDLKSQLKQSQETIAKLLEENRRIRVSILDHIHLCQDGLFEEKIMAKKTLPLHRQAKNLYRLNRELQSQVRNVQEENSVLKEELEIAKSKVSKRNTNILVEDETLR